MGLLKNNLDDCDSILLVGMKITCKCAHDMHVVKVCDGKIYITSLMRMYAPNNKFWRTPPTNEKDYCQIDNNNIEQLSKLSNLGYVLVFDWLIVSNTEYNALDFNGISKILVCGDCKIKCNLLKKNIKDFEVLGNLWFSQDNLVNPVKITPQNRLDNLLVKSSTFLYKCNFKSGSMSGDIPKYLKCTFKSKTCQFDGSFLSIHPKDFEIGNNKLLCCPRNITYPCVSPKFYDLNLKSIEVELIKIILRFENLLKKIKVAILEISYFKKINEMFGFSGIVIAFFLDLALICSIAYYLYKYIKCDYEKPQKYTE